MKVDHEQSRARCRERDVEGREVIVVRGGFACGGCRDVERVGNASYRRGLPHKTQAGILRQKLIDGLSWAESK